MTELVRPLVREVRVSAVPTVAFDVFTAHLGSWWPLGDYGVLGNGASVAFTDGVIVESAPERDDLEWGRVLRWEPPGLLAFTWHPGAPPELSSQVTVSFTADGDGTLVRLTHEGWQVYADPAAAREEYGHGWPGVLEAYREAVGSAAQDTTGAAGPRWTWVALMHTPAAGGTAVFDDPRFGEHVAFLRQVRAAGLLVAAGPLADAPGAGMAVLRLPGADGLAEAVRLATKDDASVTGGLFEVVVRPWSVVMEA